MMPTVLKLLQVVRNAVIKSTGEATFKVSVKKDGNELAVEDYVASTYMPFTGGTFTGNSFQLTFDLATVNTLLLKVLKTGQAQFLMISSTLTLMVLVLLVQ